MKVERRWPSRLERAAVRILPNRFGRSLLTLLDHDRPGRSLAVYDDDAFIVSYPKSGNTWVRFLVANLIHPESTDFESLETRVPTIYKNTTKQLASFRRPRVLKSHEYFDPRYRKLVYVVRDPRDVLVSYYHYSIRKGSITAAHSVHEFAQAFLEGKIGTVGTWGENVSSWLAARSESPSFLLVRYEDLKHRTHTELGRIAALLERDADDAVITRAVEASSFERMRALEQASGSTLQLKHKGADIPFVRKGRVGGWREELSEDVRGMVESRWGALMERLGYL